MAIVTVDFVNFDGYETVYVDGELVVEGDEVTFRDLAPILSNQTVGDVGVWIVEDDNVEVKQRLEDYADGSLTDNK